MERPPVHPRELLTEVLAFLDMTTSALARELDVPVDLVAEILDGERGITADIAARPSGWHGTSPDPWLNIQSRYEQRQAEAGGGV